MVYKSQPIGDSMTLIWPFNVTHGQMSWGKLKEHNYIPEIWNIMFLVLPLPYPPHANVCTGHNFVTNTPIKFIFKNYFRSSKKLHIDFKWLEMRSKVIFQSSKMFVGSHFVTKIKVAYWSEMVRNEIESDFRSSKMGVGGGGESEWPACKPFGDIHSSWPWANTPILVIWFICFMPNLIIRCSIYEVQLFESYVVLIWPLKIIQGQMFWGKLIHDFLYVFLINCGHNGLGLWNIAH